MILLLLALVGVPEPVRDTTYDWRCVASDGSVISEHQRQDRAMVACQNAALETVGETYLIEAGRYRVKVEPAEEPPVDPPVEEPPVEEPPVEEPPVEEPPVEEPPDEPTEPPVGAVFFDDFEGHPDWGPDGGLRVTSLVHPDRTKIPASIRAKWPMIYCSDANPANPGAKIMSGVGVGGSKGIRFWDESNGDRNSWGSECQLFATTYPDEHPELWVEYRLRVNPNMAPPSSAKMIHMGHYWAGVLDGEAATSISNTNNNKLSPYNTTSGMTISNIHDFGSGNYEFRTSVRCNSAYQCNGPLGTGFANTNGSASGTSYNNNTTNWWLRGNHPECSLILPRTWENTFGDGKWHKVEYRMVMNSRAGAQDGVFEMYWDGCRIGRRTDIPYQLGNPLPAAKGFNLFTIGGNMNNIWAGDSNAEQHTYDIDEVWAGSSRR